MYRGQQVVLGLEVVEEKDSFHLQPLVTHQDIVVVLGLVVVIALQDMRDR